MVNSVVFNAMINPERIYTEDIHVNTRHAFLAIARALDYVGVDDIHHAHRVAYIAYECAISLNWPEYKLEKTFYAGLLHDCGVTSNKEHAHLLEDMVPKNSDEHCQKGYSALKGCSLLCAFSDIVRYHHTAWSELKAIPLDTETKEISALIHLADRVDFLRSRYVNGTHPEAVTQYKELIAESIINNKEILFHPSYADAMANLVKVDGFWFAMDVDRIEAIGLNFRAYSPFNTILNTIQIKELALFLANIVDAKSPYTYNHSRRVAKIAKMLATDFGLNSITCDMIYVAGLLHDVGKLKTPDEILYKEGPLEVVEYSIIKRHTVDTFITLDNFFPESKIGQWAANHHEKIDGSGYPYHLKGDQLDTESRIISIADIFQALSQNRPYRSTLSFSQIVNIMSPLVDKGKIDKDIFQLILKNEKKYCQAATDNE